MRDERDARIAELEDRLVGSAPALHEGAMEIEKLRRMVEVAREGLSGLCVGASSMHPASITLAEMDRIERGEV